MNHYNKLTPAQAERLAMLAEECGEVIQIVGKILRQGYEGYHPDDMLRTTNRRLLRNELTDVLAVADELVDSGDILDCDHEDVDLAWQRKLQTAHHQED